jgi:uncharacterized protein (TIRG00374 family)
LSPTSTEAGADSSEAVVAPSRGRAIVRTTLKWIVPLALLGWLLSSGKLDLRALPRVFGEPTLLFINVTAWASCSIVIAAQRWRLLLRGLGFELGLLRAMRLQFVALFMNTAVPGNVAGDVFKNVLASRSLPGLTLARSLTCVMVERVLGLAALMLLSFVAVLLRWDAVYARAPALVAFVLLLAAGTVAGVAVALLAAKLAARAKSDHAPSGLVAKLRARASEVGEALLAYAKRPASLGGAFALSVLMHAVFVALFFALSKKVAPSALALFDVAVVYPIGMLTSILPLAPGGIGVGHAAFASLFALFGAPGGADVFNVFLVGQLVPNLGGVLPYLADGDHHGRARSA